MSDLFSNKSLIILGWILIGTGVGFTDGIGYGLWACGLGLLVSSFIFWVIDG